jgi:hypothetical protein
VASVVLFGRRNLLCLACVDGPVVTASLPHTPYTVAAMKSNGSATEHYPKLVFMSDDPSIGETNSSDGVLTSYVETIKWKYSQEYDTGAPVGEEITRDASGELRLLPFDPSDPLKALPKTCTYCGTLIITRDRFSKDDKPHLGDRWPTCSSRGFLNVCAECGWWFINVEHDRVISSSPPPVGALERSIWESVYKRFRIEDKAVPLAALRVHLERKKSDIYRVKKTTFEKLMGSVYSDYYPGSEVRHIGGPGDNGIDLYAIIGADPHAVQIKLRESQRHPEGPAVVRDLIGAMMICKTKTRHGHVVTTAEQFTTAAQRTAQNPELEREGIQIELKALPDILRMLGVANRKLRSAWEGPWDSARSAR